MVATGGLAGPAWAMRQALLVGCCREAEVRRRYVKFVMEASFGLGGRGGVARVPRRAGVAGSEALGESFMAAVSLDVALPVGASF